PPARKRKTARRDAPPPGRLSGLFSIDRLLFFWLGTHFLSIFRPLRGLLLRIGCDAVLMLLSRSFLSLCLSQGRLDQAQDKLPLGHLPPQAGTFVLQVPLDPLEKFLRNLECHRSALVRHLC